MPRVVALLALLILLDACSTQPVTTPDQRARSWQQHRLAVAQLSGWRVNARVSVSHDNEAWSGKLLWLQQPDHYRIQFNAPFGQGAFQLEGEAAHAVMRLSDGKVFEDVSAEAMIARELGWQLPVSALRYWVAGVPLPGTAPPLVLNEQGRLSRLQQGSWTIRYSDYVAVDDLLLPHKLTLDNDSLKLRLVIDAWSLSPRA